MGHSSAVLPDTLGLSPGQLDGPCEGFSTNIQGPAAPASASGPVGKCHCCPLPTDTESDDIETPSVGPEWMLVLKRFVVRLHRLAEGFVPLGSPS